MPPRRHLSEQQRQRAIGLLMAGQSQRHVAVQFNVSQSVIGRLWQRYLQTHDVHRRPGQGRPRKTTAAQDRRLSTLAKRQRFQPAKSLRNNFEQATGIRLSTQTVRNRLHAANLQAYRPAVRPPLTARHRRNRLLFARQHVMWTRARYRNVLFTDESKFNLMYHDGRRRVWRQRNERFKDCCVSEHNRFGGGSVLVWGGISYDGATDLYVIRDGSLTGARYRDEIIHDIVRPYAGAVGPDFVLMDDNARPHRARVVTQYLNNEGIEQMEWPANSPDLNPIEHAWDMLQRRVSARQQQPQTLQELENALNQEWRRIPQADFRKLISSFPKRCREVITARGGHTHY